MRLQEVIYRVSVVTVNLNLVHNWESDTVVQLAEVTDLLLRARFLATELVAWETKDDQALVLVLLVQALQILVLWGETTLGCNVDNQDNFALQGIELESLTFLVLAFQLVKTLSSHCICFVLCIFVCFVDMNEL